MPRTELAADHTLYVDKLNGSDSNTGLSLQAPLKHAQTALYKAVDDYDFKRKTITIKHAANQTITEELQVWGGGVGGGSIVFDGGMSTIDVAGTNGIGNYGSGASQTFVVQNVKIKTTAPAGGLVKGFGIVAQVPGYMVVRGAVEIHGSGLSGVCAAAPGAIIQISNQGGVRFWGNCAQAFLASDGGLICGTDIQTDIWFVNNPHFSDATMVAAACGIIQPMSWVYQGSGATGRKYRVDAGGIILTGRTPLPPGDKPGIKTNGGQYV